MIIYSSHPPSSLPHELRAGVPKPISHKGQNGKVLVIGGSSLFHGAVIWAAQAASHIADMVHVASTIENNEIIRSIKTKWQTGMVISLSSIPDYAQEDDVILIGNGMMRDDNFKLQMSNVKLWNEIVKIKEEGRFTREVVNYLITHFPDKQYIFDAGALQMMDKEWLTLLHKNAIVTPHQKEFQRLFCIDLSDKTIEQKEQLVTQTAREYNCIILMKAVDDIVSDGVRTIRITGGNAGLTKGGTGDLLAGIVAGFATYGHSLRSAVIGSYVLKRTADTLFAMKGYWYSVHDILSEFPATLKEVLITHG